MRKYIGGGAYIHGVPARDLTDVEAEEFADVIAEQERLTGVKLYQPVAPSKPAKSTTKGDE